LGEEGPGFQVIGRHLIFGGLMLIGIEVLKVFGTGTCQ
jgi:hypothetical protein